MDGKSPEIFSWVPSLSLDPLLDDNHHEVRSYQCTRKRTTVVNAVTKKNTWSSSLWKSLRNTWKAIFWVFHRLLFVLIKSTPDKRNTHCPFTVTAIIPDPLLKLMEEKELKEAITQIKIKFFYEVFSDQTTTSPAENTTFGVCLSLSGTSSTRDLMSTFSIYKGIQALYPVPSRINRYHQEPNIAVLYWPSTQLHHLVTYSWAAWS